MDIAALDSRVRGNDKKGLDASVSGAAQVRLVTTH